MTDLTRTEAYDYELDPALIARYPTRRRDGSRLLAVRRGRPESSAGHPAPGMRDLRFRELPALVPEGDLLVVNESRVLPVRLLGRKPTGAACEVLLLRPRPPGSFAGARRFEALVRPGAKLRPGRRIIVAGDLSLLVEERTARGGRIVRIESSRPTGELLEAYGRLPLPPYLGRGEEPLDRERYQTVYASRPGSVAAPTAGLHFTSELLGELRRRGVALACLTLHVGPGTFRPVTSGSVEGHAIDAESWELSPEAADSVAETRARGGRVWAVGTTVVRALESAARAGGLVRSGRGTTELFIRPGYTFRVVDGVITNFHLPRSTLLMLVSAFAGYEATMRAYRHAARAGYRFYSYGDAMAVVPAGLRGGTLSGRCPGVPPVPEAPGFAFELLATEGAARSGCFHTPHGVVQTPAFMPVGTLGAVKTLSPDEVARVGASMVLANTYHLYLRPGHELVRALGGLHRFMRWEGPILTDSGGFQVHSLAAMREIRDEGVVFRSHIDGSRHLFTPEGVMEIQHALGADVVMAFDECPPGGSTRAAIERANGRTLRWLERCRRRFEALAVDGAGGSGGTGAPQSLFPVLQGSVYPGLRSDHLRGVRSIGAWDGYAIGGLSVGEPKPGMWSTLEALHEELPAARPRYLMGVGYPEDLLEAIGRGCDLFDCVAPTRNARHGTAWVTAEGQVNMKAARFRADSGPLDPACEGECCRLFDRAYLRHLTVAGEALAHRLLSMHNLRFLIRLAAEARRRVERGEFASWSSGWLERYRAGG